MKATEKWSGKIGKMLGWIKPHTCPIEGCNYHWRLRDGLMAHLYNTHLKADLVAYILKHVMEA